MWFWVRGVADSLAGSLVWLVYRGRWVSGERQSVVPFSMWTDDECCVAAPPATT